MKIKAYKYNSTLRVNLDLLNRALLVIFFILNRSVKTSDLRCKSKIRSSKMDMFCYQCQETAKNIGCEKTGVCGKNAEVSNLQDLLVFVLKGIALCSEAAKDSENDYKAGRFMTTSLFSTITNANFDPDRFITLIKDSLEFRDNIKNSFPDQTSELKHDCVTWFAENTDDYKKKGREVGVMTTSNEDVRSLQELIIYGLKGITAYGHHSYILGYEDKKIYDFMIKGIAATVKDISTEELVALVLETGETAVTTMALLDKANTATYGNPEITSVNIGTGDNPGILISGHDLKDMENLLKQTEGSGVDVYTHSEMLPANYYPAFKKYSHFVGNYGNSWWKQGTEFDKFNGPILMTTNCIVPVRQSYKNRIFTTGTAGYPGVKHIPSPPKGKEKNFSEIIELAKKCDPPEEIETGEITGGFAHHQISELADKIVEAVKNGSIKKFIVMAGCDGRQKGREYFTQVAEQLPEDTVILTAGCAKYRYIKLKLGDINGIPRILDSGQCNDSYSIAATALKLKEIFGVDDINELPISYDIAWYEQKAVTVFLALLYLGIKNIRLGPTLPAFLSPGVTKVLVDKFNIMPVTNPADDIADMTG